jgi:hypothetical protein
MFSFYRRLLVNRTRLFVALTLLTMLLLMGNVPAPYWACEGRAVGDSCSYGYATCMGPNGVCQRDPNAECVDNPDTEVNECLICVTQ